MDFTQNTFDAMKERDAYAAQRTYHEIIKVGKWNAVDHDRRMNAL